MATANKFGESLNSLFKSVYADKIKNLIPDGVKLYNDIKFASKEKLGGVFVQPVVLGLEHGITYAESTDDAFNLQAAVTGAIKDAQVRGNFMVLRSVLGYAAAQRSLSGKEGAFEDATKFLVSNMLRSLVKKVEMSILYGQMGLGVVASVSGTTITVETAEFAPGIFIGGENMPLEIRDASGATVRGTANIASVDISARTVTVDAMPAGVVATDVIWHKGAYGNEMAGIHKILTNTGTLFNISAATYSLWKGNSQSAGSAALSLATVEKAIGKCVNKGLESDVRVYVSTGAWNDLLTEQNAKRMYDQSYSSSEVKNGSKAIMFYGQNGAIEIVPSIYVKEGYAFVLALEDWKKIGSTDITFERPNDGERYFRQLTDQFGFELMAAVDLAVFCQAPGKAAVITGIVNS